MSTKNLFQSKAIPELLVYPITSIEKTRFKEVIDKSLLLSYKKPLEIWTSKDSNRALSYLTHGIFRYFGKFPPPIARYLIQNYTKPNDLVVDPMCGSGTTAVEAMLLKRSAICFDVNPLAVLITKTKVTYINTDDFDFFLKKIVEDVEKNNKNVEPNLIGLRNPKHWFLPETIISLNKIRQAIERLEVDENIKNIFYIIFLSIVRRVSRATTQQGRLFLDVVTAEKNALPFFIEKAIKLRSSFSTIPKKTGISIEMNSILDEYKKTSGEAKLVICHPPYFNNYKYSGVNSLELSWMQIDHSLIRKNEVREAFKAGKPEKAKDYVKDMKIVLRNISKMLKTFPTL